MRGRGSRRRVSGDLATAAPVTAPARPLAGPGPVLPPGMRAQVPGPAGGDLGHGDPRQGAEVSPPALPQGKALEVRGFMRAGDKGGAPALCPQAASKAF